MHQGICTISQKASVTYHHGNRLTLLTTPFNCNVTAVVSVWTLKGSKHRFLKIEIYHLSYAASQSRQKQSPKSKWSWECRSNLETKVVQKSRKVWLPLKPAREQKLYLLPPRLKCALHSTALLWSTLHCTAETGGTGLRPIIELQKVAFSTLHYCNCKNNFTEASKPSSPS